MPRSENSTNRVLAILRDAWGRLSAKSIEAEYCRRYGRDLQVNTIEKNICHLRKRGQDIQDEKISIPTGGYYAIYWYVKPVERLKSWADMGIEEKRARMIENGYPADSPHIQKIVDYNAE